VKVALLTNYLTGYRVPLYELLAERHGLEVLCYGGGDRYVPSWFGDLDAQLAQAPFPARRLNGRLQAVAELAARDYDAVIAPFAGGAMLPLAYAAARARRRKFILWASVWAQPRSAGHLLAMPVTRRIYREADAVIAYGEHVKRFVRRIRGRDEDVFVAPQSVEPELFARDVTALDVEAFRGDNELDGGPLVLYCGRLVAEKGIEVLLSAWQGRPGSARHATLVIAGDGPLAESVRGRRDVAFLGAVPRSQLAVAYAAAVFTVVPSIPTPRFREPWGLVCNESMHQARPVLATSAVGAVAGGLVRDRDNGIVVPPGDPPALRAAIDLLLGDAQLRHDLGESARKAVAPYTYEAMAAAFGNALAAAGVG